MLLFQRKKERQPNVTEEEGAWGEKKDPWGEKEDPWGKQSFPRLSPPGGFSFCRNRSFAQICDNFHQVFDPHRIPISILTVVSPTDISFPLTSCF